MSDSAGAARRCEIRAAGGPERARTVRPDGDFLQRALAASRSCGVTRLADITGLDRLGLPVWQAVRPAGRALSVHQGKGASHEDARIGALCEAMESHCAENAPADGPRCSFAALPLAERAQQLGDYCRNRDSVPGLAEEVQWCAAADLLTGRRLWLPHALVSLDYTSGLPSLFERSSLGLGAGPQQTSALGTSLLEVIERDSMGAWDRLDRASKVESSVQPKTIPFGWFQAWCARFAALDVGLKIFSVETIVGVAAFKCVIGGAAEFGESYRRFSGSAAHGDPEIALFKALAEAMQSRLTLIAGARDDILPSYYARPPASARVGANSSQRGRPWAATEPVPCDAVTLAEGLAAAGYPQVAVKRLDEGLEGVSVTKAFVAGLGSLTRTRRTAR